MLLYQGLATGKMSVVAPITAVLAVVVSAVTGMVIGDRLSVGAFTGVALAMMAITLIGQDGTRENTKAELGWGAAHGLAAALSAGVLIGVFFAALKQTNPASSLLPLISARLAAFVALGAVALSRRLPWRIERDVVWLIVAGGALDIFANVLYLLATREGMLTIAATLTSLYPRVRSFSRAWFSANACGGFKSLGWRARGSALCSAAQARLPSLIRTSFLRCVDAIEPCRARAREIS